jgi:hypothetical protein
MHPSLRAGFEHTYCIVLFNSIQYAITHPSLVGVHIRVQHAPPPREPLAHRTTTFQSAPRYHSLLVEEASLPACLEPIAWTAGGGSAVVRLARDAPSPAGPPAAPPPQPAAGQPAAATSGDAALAEEGRQQRARSGDAATTSCSTLGAAETPANSGLVAAAAATNSGSGRGLLMGLAHCSRPHWGVQFHPESVATAYGVALLRNFRDLAADHLRSGGGPGAAQLPPPRWEGRAGGVGGRGGWDGGRGGEGRCVRTGRACRLGGGDRFHRQGRRRAG